MPRKKKKGRASLDHDNRYDKDFTPSKAKNSNSQAQAQQEEQELVVEVVDSLCLNLVISNKSSSSSSGGGGSSSSSLSSSIGVRVVPKLMLHKSDALRLDVQDDDPIFVLFHDKDQNSNEFIIGTALCHAVIQKHNTIGNKQQQLHTHLHQSIKNDTLFAAGHCQIFPSDVFTTRLLQSNNHENTIPPNDSITVTSTPNDQSTKQIPQTPSSSNSKFSFARGGGGDALIQSPSPTPSPSYTTPTKLTTPNVKSNQVLKHKVTIIPKDSSKLGHIVESMLCRDATRIQIEYYHQNNTLIKSHDNNHGNTSALLPHRLFIAYTTNSYVAANYCIKISIGGQSTLCTIANIIDDNQNIKVQQESLQRKMESLSIHGQDQDHNQILPMLKESIAIRNLNLLLYKVTHNTKPLVPMPKILVQQSIPTHRSQLVVGIDLIANELKSILNNFLLNINDRRGGGILLHGPSGVGKTCLAKQIAYNMKNCYVQIVHCAKLQSMTTIIGQAEQYLVRLFHSKNNVPKQTKILIFDDIHFICAQRGKSFGGANTDQLCATLLGLMDGVSSYISSQTIIVIATTNNPWILDTALRRPGRLDYEVEVPLPQEPELRGKILEFHVQRCTAPSKICQNEIDYTRLGTIAKGFTGADCRLAVKEAIRYSAATATATTTIPALSGTNFASKYSQSTAAELTAQHLEYGIRNTKPSAIKSVTVEIPKVPWSDIGGMDHVKNELRNTIEMNINNSQMFQQFDIQPPRGILLYGPPGCSKTLMARALATEGQFNFLTVKGPELLSKWLGESERSLSALFKRARLSSPCIIFFDEIDAIASKRGNSSGGSGGERLLSQLLTELDGIGTTQQPQENQQKVVVVGATNRPDLLDSALTRPGRIDKMIYVGPPDMESRKHIFKLGLRNKACDPSVNVERLADDALSGGLSGAEVIAVCRNAALLALEEYDFNILGGEYYNNDNNHSDKGELCIQMNHLISAIRETERQITPDMIYFYENFKNNTKIK